MMTDKLSLGRGLGTSSKISEACKKNLDPCAFHGTDPVVVLETLIAVSATFGAHATQHATPAEIIETPSPITAPVLVVEPATTIVANARSRVPAQTLATTSTTIETFFVHAATTFFA